MARLLPQIRRFPPATKGATAVEFAIIGPILILLVIGIVELGLLLAARTLLDNAAFAASRVGKTGYSASGQTQAQTISAAVGKAVSRYLDTSKLTLTSKAYSDYGDIGKPEPYTDLNKNGKWDSGESYTDVNGNGSWDSDQGRTGAGDAGQIVLYTITYNWPLVTPWLKGLVGTGGVFPISTKIVVKNEPF